MTQASALWLQAAILAALLSCAAALVIAHRYRIRMQQLMRAPSSAKLPVRQERAADSTLVGAGAPEGSLAGNRAAGLRLSALLIVASCLVAATGAVIFCLLKFPNDPLRFSRVAPITLLQLWPIVPALALVWRWSRPRLIASLLMWLAAVYAVLLAVAAWRGLDIAPLLLWQMMASEVGLPLVLLAMVFLSGATRAIAPWLFLPLALLVWSSLMGLETMKAIGEGRAPLLEAWVVRLDPWLGWLPVAGVFAGFILLPWLVAWWPARWMGRALGRAYSRKRLSDLLVVFTAVWGIVLMDKVVPLIDEAGPVALAMFLPLIWIPATLLLDAGARRRRDRPPTLLVLRVFQHDALAQSLFDDVVERWRLSGNTVLIAGTDLADRTLDADDIFRFLDGRLAERFIVSVSDIPRRIAELDMAADVDGRYRVNECYCHDTTWQDALQALVRQSDVVLMDLRGFQAHNAGCRYELTTLAQTDRDLRIVVLTDERTDRVAAHEAVAPDRRGRFTWIDAKVFTAHTRRDVLSGLFAGLEHSGAAPT